MLYPLYNNVSNTRDMVTAFMGYNHTMSATEGEFYDEKNMTTSNYPVLSPRKQRGFCLQGIEPSGILDKEVLCWVDGSHLWVDNVEITSFNLSTTSDMLPKQLVKMGSKIIIFPDKIWYDVESAEYGNMAKKLFDIDDTGYGIGFGQVDANGEAITWHLASEYEQGLYTPTEGAYMMSEKDGIWSLKQYSATTGIWQPVATTYCKMAVTSMYPVVDMRNFFKDGDGVKITINISSVERAIALIGQTWDTLDLRNIFVNDEGIDDNGDEIRSVTTVVRKVGDEYLVFPGIVHWAGFTLGSIKVMFERIVPDMAYITECNNRIWGCSMDGHEIYASKLGDCTNWQVFAGISTDSYAATIGSDGIFTGAITYLGYPMFFKEESFVKVSVSATGAHQLKETVCRGVQDGSYRSMQIVNEVLYYKSTNCVCAYQGSLPVSISDALGDISYHDGVGGSINDAYYLTMKDSDEVSHLFVFDTKRGMWSKEDNTDAVYFCKHKDDLYYFDDTDKKLKSVYGTLLYTDATTRAEGNFDWYVESATIGYASPDKKYVQRISVRIKLEVGTQVDFWIQYDSDGLWEHKFFMAGSGTKTFTVPVIPKRCDHFKYKITGNGDAKIIGITKTMEEGSDI